MSLPLQLIAPLLAFAVSTTVALLAGAALGPAATVGQLVFAAAVVAVLLRGSPRRA